MPEKKPTLNRFPLLGLFAYRAAKRMGYPEEGRHVGAFRAGQEMELEPQPDAAIDPRRLVVIRPERDTLLGGDEKGRSSPRRPGGFGRRRYGSE
jgi:hypothetical protein